MSYTREERLDIGKQIYNNEISKTDAKIQYQRGNSQGLYEALQGRKRPSTKKQNTKRRKHCTNQYALF